MYSMTNLARSLLHNQRKSHPISVLAKGFHRIEEEVFLILPTQLGRGRVLGVVNVHLTEEENLSLMKSAWSILDVQQWLSISQFLCSYAFLLCFTWFFKTLHTYRVLQCYYIVSP
ncbi:hypothetical protein SUGI_0269130 [Cryptomeria japonica]|nr:hypothetical protein SUGI_0269130 [Cryptomeria japonica]